MNQQRKRIRVRTAAEKRERTLQLESREVLTLPRPSQMEIGRKIRMVDGHEAVILDYAGERAQKVRLLKRCFGMCECGCGTMLISSGAERHHWLGRTRGNRCDCDKHIQLLAPECHRTAQSQRLGAPYWNVPK